MMWAEGCLLNSKTHITWHRGTRPFYHNAPTWAYANISTTAAAIIKSRRLSQCSLNYSRRPKYMGNFFAVQLAKRGAGLQLAVLMLASAILAICQRHKRRTVLKNF